MVSTIFLSDSAEVDGDLIRVLKVEEIRSIDSGYSLKAVSTKLVEGINVRVRKGEKSF